jgi:molybdopterin converting factor subunit 1
MRLRVLLFATLREIVGQGEIAWSADPGTTVDAFLAAFLQEYPRLAPHRKTLLVAVNYVFAEPTAVLQDGDEVALLPPVSGGAP